MSEFSQQNLCDWIALREELLGKVFSSFLVIWLRLVWNQARACEGSWVRSSQQRWQAENRLLSILTIFAIRRNKYVCSLEWRVRLAFTHQHTLEGYEILFLSVWPTSLMERGNKGLLTIFAVKVAMSLSHNGFILFMFQCNFMKADIIALSCWNWKFLSTQIADKLQFSVEHISFCEGSPVNVITVDGVFVGGQESLVSLSGGLTVITWWLQGLH